MPNVETKNPGVETRLKMKQRGFYHDKSPGFAGVRDAHEKAKATAGEKKVAAFLGAQAALEKFGFLHRKEEDPVHLVSELFRYEDFGLPTKGKNPKDKEPTRGRIFGPPSPEHSSGGAGEFSSAYSPDRVMDYTGV